MCFPVNKKIEKEVEEYEATYRGRELPGFINYKTFETMVKDQIKQLEEPAVKKLKDVGGKWLHEFQEQLSPFPTSFHSSKLLCLLVFPFPPDAVRKVFIQLAQSSFIGFPNLVKIAKVAIFYEPLKT